MDIMRVSRTYLHIWYEVRFVSPKKKRRTPGFLEVSKESSPPAAVSSSPLRSNAKSESGWCWRHPVKWYYIELYIFYIYYIQWSNRNIYSNRNKQYQKPSPMEKSCWLTKNICWWMADATMTGSMFFVAGIFIDVLGVEENESNLSSDRTDKVLLSIVCTDNFGLLILYLEAGEKTQKSSQSCGCSATEQSKLRSQITNATSHLPFLSRNSSYQIAEQIPPLFFSWIFRHRRFPLLEDHFHLRIAVYSRGKVLQQPGLWGAGIIRVR